MSKIFSTTCYYYPRIINLVDRVFEKLATISCPVKAMIVLINKNGINFIQIQEQFERPVSINKVIDVKDFRTRNNIKKYLWDIRTFCIQLIKTREYSI
ncbi:hypothetical protein ACAG39_08260 [Caldicellulosiruptoraceae bacterium PP1]